MMNRIEAIELARKCAKAKPQSYYAEPFQPHEWVIDSILRAAREGGVIAAQQTVHAMKKLVEELQLEIDRSYRA